MGYYSEVAITLSQEAFEYVNKKYELCPYKDYPFIDADSVFTLDGNVLFYWKSAKWYHDLNRVQEAKRTFQEIDEKGIGQYGFTRIGKEPGDIEEDGKLIRKKPFYLNLHYGEEITFNTLQAILEKL